MREGETLTLYAGSLGPHGESAAGHHLLPPTPNKRLVSPTQGHSLNQSKHSRTGPVCSAWCSLAALALMPPKSAGDKAERDRQVPWGVH